MDSFFKYVNNRGFTNNEMNKNNYILINIILAADFAVGKTAFILRLQNQKYKNYMEQDKRLMATMGIDMFILYLNYKNINVKLIIWDTEWLNSPQFFFLSTYFQKADIVFLFYDSSDKSTLESIKKQKNFFDCHCKKNTIFALIRNKYDITEELISDEEAIEFADRNNMLFFHLSLHEKNETGIKELFENVLNEYFKRKI